MKFNKIFLSAILVLGSLGAPARALPAEAAVVDRVVAVVNEDVITLYDIETLLRPLVQNIKNQRLSPERELQTLAQLRTEMLNNLIDTKLTEQEVKRHKVAISEEEIDNYIRQVRQRRAASEEQLRGILAEQGMTVEEYRKEVKLQLQRTKLVNREVRSKVVITEAEIKAYYEKNRAKYGGGTQYHLWNLFVRVSGQASSASRAAAQNMLEAVLADLRQGRSFQEIVRWTAEKPSAVQGSDLGLFRIEELTPRLREAVRELKAGQYSSIVETDFGYQIVFIQDMQETASRPLAQVESEIQDILFRERVDSRFVAWLSDLRKRSHIQVVAAP
ncbi:MAG: peptidyl-prolyl cis-trans isomerase [Desulfobacterales bacterium]|jgi:peptidyl-prolyl cis-trans isomerase SurA|nr:peptidyl-prolyl cis-trans isomerase [Desulfobacterales bacterium]